MEGTAVEEQEALAETCCWRAGDVSTTVVVMNHECGRDTKDIGNTRCGAAAGDGGLGGRGLDTVYHGAVVCTRGRR